MQETKRKLGFIYDLYIYIRYFHEFVNGHELLFHIWKIGFDPVIMFLFLSISEKQTPCGVCRLWILAINIMFGSLCYVFPRSSLTETRIVFLCIVLVYWGIEANCLWFAFQNALQEFRE